MASGAFVFFDKAKLNFSSATNLLNPANTFKLSLHTSAYTPNNTTHEVFADVTNELATGFGYTAGGITLARASLAATALTPAGGQVLTNNLQYALAPEMTRLKARFDEGKMAPLLNVGPLITPLTLAPARRIKPS